MKHRNWRRITLRLIVGFAILWLVWFAPVPFVKSWWLSANPDTGGLLNVRLRMADWLVLTHRLNGRSHAQVVELLGEPPPHDKFRGQGVAYVLGPERGFVSIDYEWLLLTLGKAGTVENAAVVTD